MDPTKLASCQTFGLHHMAKSSSVMLSLAATQLFFSDFLHIFEVSPSLALPPHWATIGEFHICLRLLDQYHHDYLVADYQSRPNSSNGAATVVTSKAVFLSFLTATTTV